MIRIRKLAFCKIGVEDIYKYSAVCECGAGQFLFNEGGTFLLSNIRSYSCSDCRRPYFNDLNIKMATVLGLQSMTFLDAVDNKVENEDDQDL